SLDGVLARIRSIDTSRAECLTGFTDGGGEISEPAEAQQRPRASDHPPQSGPPCTGSRERAFRQFPRSLPRTLLGGVGECGGRVRGRCACQLRSEEHTSELQSRSDLVCRLLLEKKKNLIR